MLVHCGLLLLCFSCTTTTGDGQPSSDFSSFALWPSVHNAAALYRIRRASVANVDQPTAALGPNEGVNVPLKPADSLDTSLDTAIKPNVSNNSEPKVNQETPKVSGNPDATPNSEVSDAHEKPAPVEAAKVLTTQLPNTTVTNTTLNATNTDTTSTLNLNNPGVVIRGLIVFGGFSLMAAAYFVFFKRKNLNNDMGSSLGLNDTNQFRYGVLQSEDMKDNIESTRVPLTMDSEDEIDDDLEIFDLMQKKKSLSYVNLQQNDEEIVLSPRDTADIEGDNLLLDIEDASSDTLINWSSNGSKSIL